MERKVDVLYLSHKQVEGRKNCFKLQKKSIPTHCYCGILLADCFKHVLEKQTLRNNGPLISLLSSLWNNEGVQTVEV